MQLPLQICSNLPGLLYGKYAISVEMAAVTSAFRFKENKTSLSVKVSDCYKVKERKFRIKIMPQW